MSLSNEQKKRYRSIGHGLSPVVTIAGNGMTANVLAEIDRALNDHELIKIKLVIEDKDSRKEVVETIVKAMSASVVQEIGKVVVLLRPAKQPNKNFPTSCASSKRTPQVDLQRLIYRYHA